MSWGQPKCASIRLPSRGELQHLRIAQGGLLLALGSDRLLLGPPAGTAWMASRLAEIVRSTTSPPRTL